MSLGNVRFALKYRPKRTINTMATPIPVIHGSWIIFCLLIMLQAGCSEQKEIIKTSPNVLRFQFATMDDNGYVDGARLYTCRHLDKLAGEKYVILTFHNPQIYFLRRGVYSLRVGRRIPSTRA